MSAALEQRYRQALRWYPTSWRQRNEDAVIGTLLDAAEERGELAPAKSDLRSLRAHGILTRLGWIGRILPSAVRDRVAAIALGTGLAISLWGIVFSVITAGALHDIWHTHDLSWMNPSGVVTFGPFASLDVIPYALWLVAFGTALAGRPGLTRIVLLATLPADTAARVLGDTLHQTLYPNTSTVALLGILALFGMLGAPRATARWRGWICTGAVLALGTLTWALFLGYLGPANVASDFDYVRHFFNGERPLVGWISAVGPLVAIVCLALGKWVWSAVITITSLPWLALYASAAIAGRSPGDFLAWVGIAIVLAAIAAAIALTTRRVHIHVTFTRER